MSLEKGQKYCTKCGCRLNMVKEHYGWSAYSGTEQFTVRGCCPLKRYWWDAHNQGQVEFWGPIIVNLEDAVNYEHFAGEAA